MADAAAFFATKKKKKTPFKFNANNIDASTVEKKVHVDAPALSTDEIAPLVGGGDSAVAADTNDSTEQWDDEALAATLTQKKTVAASGNASELLDMKALDLKRSEQGDIQEKLRVEENKAKLAAAREGMEKEAQRLKEEKEKKEHGASSSAMPRFGAAAAGMTAGGAKWLPPHMRGGGTPLSSRVGMGGSATQRLDTEDENLFPDLAAADAILERQKAQGPAYKAPKKTPVGGGATWGAKSKEPIKKPEPEQPEPAKNDEPAAAEVSAEASTAAADPEMDVTPGVATETKAPIKPKKKKKKDLSTFKSSS